MFPFEENSENEINAQRLSNYLEMLDVTSEKHSFSNFMCRSLENHTLFEDQLLILRKNLCFVIIQTRFQNLWKAIFQLCI